MREMWVFRGAEGKLGVLMGAADAGARWFLLRSVASFDDDFQGETRFWPV